MNAMKDKLIKMSILENRVLNFFTIFIWDNSNYFPSYLNNKTKAHLYLGRAFSTIASKKILVAGSSQDSNLVHIDVMRTSFRQAIGGKYKTSVVSRDRIIKGFSFNDVAELHSKAEMEEKVLETIDFYGKQKMECIGVFYNLYQDLQDLYVKRFVAHDTLPKIDVINNDVGNLNILVIRDKKLNIYMAFPWKSKRYEKYRDLLTGDFLHFKSFLLEISKTTFAELGKEKERIKAEWCEARFFKLLNRSVEGIEIENIPVNEGDILGDIIPEFIKLVEREGSEKLINYPHFSTSEKKLVELNKVLGIKRDDFYGVSSHLISFLTTKDIRTAKFNSPNKPKDFSHLEDTSYSRPCNKEDSASYSV